MAEIKTKPTSASVEAFIKKVPDKQKQEDCFVIIDMMKKITGEEPKMWGASMIGFGNVRYKSPNTDREVDWMKMGFAPRKANISLYLFMQAAKHEDELKKLGKHKTGVGCLYINKLRDIDLKVLERLMKTAAKNNK